MNVLVLGDLTNDIVRNLELFGGLFAGTPVSIGGLITTNKLEYILFFYTYINLLLT